MNDSLQKITILVMACGNGARFGSDIPKQYQKIAEKEVLRHTLEAFKDYGTMRVVINSEHVNLFEKATQGLDVGTPIFGGETRQRSVYDGLMAIAPCEFVLIHDAVRPYVPQTIVERVIGALDEHDAVIPALEVVDTLKMVNANHYSLGTQPRIGLWQAQTPQGFRYEKIKTAHMILADSNDLTDDASLFEALGWPVFVVKGHLLNRKMTYQEDLEFMEMILR